VAGQGGRSSLAAKSKFKIWALKYKIKGSLSRKILEKVKTKYILIEK